MDTLERIQILEDLRAGMFDVLVGVNLLREGARPARSGAGGDPRRRQGGFPAQRAVADADRGTRRAPFTGQRDPLCRHLHRLHALRHRAEQPPARETGALQHGARHAAAPGAEERHGAKHPALRAHRRPGNSGELPARRRPLHGRRGRTENLCRKREHRHADRQGARRHGTCGQIARLPRRREIPRQDVRTAETQGGEPERLTRPARGYSRTALRKVKYLAAR